MPQNVTAFKIHYSVWHTDVGTQSVDFQFLTQDLTQEQEQYH